MNERRKIFIIEDDLDLCLLIKTYFLRKNYKVYIAHTFDDALARVIECLPDIILLTTTTCQNPEEQIKKLKEAAPYAEIIINDFQALNRHWSDLPTHGWYAGLCMVPD